MGNRLFEVAFFDTGEDFSQRDLTRDGGELFGWYLVARTDGPYVVVGLSIPLISSIGEFLNIEGSDLRKSNRVLTRLLDELQNERGSYLKRAFEDNSGIATEVSEFHRIPRIIGGVYSGGYDVCAVSAGEGIHDLSGGIGILLSGFSDTERNFRSPDYDVKDWLRLLDRNEGEFIDAFDRYLASRSSVVRLKAF